MLAGLTLPSRPGAPQVASLRGRGPSHPPPPFSVCSVSQQGCPCLLPSSLPVPAPTKPSRHGTGSQCLSPGKPGRQSGPFLGSSPMVPEAERMSGMKAAVDAFEQTQFMMPQHTLACPRSADFWGWRWNKASPATAASPISPSPTKCLH